MLGGTFSQIHNGLVSVRSEQFFDRKRIVNRLSKISLRFLNRAGGHTRKVARRSMRRRKGASPPGSPPFAHTGYLRDYLFYGLDEIRDSVVIGPSLLAGAERRGVSVPSLHEFGGSIFNARTGRDDIYEPRPYMGPALELTEPLLPGFFNEAYAKG